jgi:hypothetical protein
MSWVAVVVVVAVSGEWWWVVVVGCGWVMGGGFRLKH